MQFARYRPESNASRPVRGRGLLQRLLDTAGAAGCCVLASWLCASLAFATIESGVVNGGQSATSGGAFVKLSVPFTLSVPANSVGEDTFNTFDLYGFDEDQNIELAAELPVDLLVETGAPGVLPAGSTVASHYIFFDPAGTSSTTQVGRVSFDSDIVAVITSGDRLQGSDFLANTGVIYLNPQLRGLEAGDLVSVVGPRTIEVDWAASTPGDYIRVLTRFSPAAADCAVEVVFAVDTSGSMNDDISALCASISAVEGQLIAKGINARTHLLGITQTRNCLTNTVRNVVGQTVPGNNGACDNTLNQSESWGQATASLARNFPWQPGATRVVIPISDEGPCDGGGGPDIGSINQADRDVITNAITQSQRAGVFVSPIASSGATDEMFELAQSLATATGGEAVRSNDPALDIAQSVGTLVEQACAQDICEVINALDDTPRPVTLRTIGTSFNNIVGIDYFEPADNLAVSVNYSNGQPFNFELVQADGTHSPFSDISGLTDEVKIGTARSTQSGGYTDGNDIPAGTLYSGTGVEGQILRVNPDRSTRLIDTGARGLFRGSLHVDRTGVFDGDLIAVTTAGAVLRVDENDEARLLAQVNEHLEGVIVVPDDSRYGDIA
ncbi:MAG: hypothetical protein KDK91_32545, partial [Gammaproteobacteria bacterium]|nr:hypothetical protein [Gammaproteobacteria bacterium]